MRGSVAFKRVPPTSFWLANKQISPKASDLCLVGARYAGENLLVLVEAKDYAVDHSRSKTLDWLWSSEPTIPSDLLKDPVRQVAAKRSFRALMRILRNATAH